MEHVMNLFKTGLLMAGLTALLMAFGFVLGRETGMLLALAFAIATNMFTYWNADKMVLRMNGARQIARQDSPQFYDMIERLANRAQLPMPKVYIMEQDQPNAFATGRNPENSAVAATTGLLQRLSPDEIEGVMAHELAHVKNRDTLIMAVAATIAGAISMLANFSMFMPRDRNSPASGISMFAMMIMAPLGAMIVQMAVSRTREYAADRMGAEISGKPMALASALRRIEGAARGIPNEAAEANPAMAHVFIINPLHGGFRDNLFSTHPATENRIAALQQLAAEMPASPKPEASGPWG
jgi:heat shock protein HtpX